MRESKSITTRNKQKIIRKHFTTIWDQNLRKTNFLFRLLAIE